MFCDQCGSRAEASWKFCKNCGNNLAPSVAASVSTASKQSAAEFSLFSDWQAAFYSQPHVQKLWPSEDEEDEDGDLDWSPEDESIEDYGSRFMNRPSDPLIWLKAQDSDVSEFPQWRQEQALSEVHSAAESIIEGTSASGEVVPPYWAIINSTSAFGASVFVRLTSSEIDGQSVLRASVPVGYLKDAERYLGDNPTARWAAGWLGVKARTHLMSAIDLSGNETSIADPFNFSLMSSISGRGELGLEPEYLIRPMASVGPSGCDPDGTFYGRRGHNHEVPLGKVPAGDAPMCLYAGVELLAGRHVTTTFVFYTNLLRGLSALVDSVHMSPGLIDQLGIEPFSLP